METTSFKQFVVEAEYRKDDFARVISTIERRMPSLLGTPIYRFGGEDGTEKLRHGTGYLYFFGHNKAFRVREKHGEIFAFDVWTTYTPNATADFTLDTQGLNVATITKELKKFAKFFKSPSHKDIEINNLAEGVSFSFDTELFEAKSVSSDAFIKLAQQQFSDDTIRDMTWEQIVKVAKDNNVAAPNGAFLKAQKIGRGKWSLFPLADAPEPVDHSMSTVKSEPRVEPADNTPKKKEPILYIKVTAQDPDTKKFISAADNKTAQALYQKIQGAIDVEPTTKQLRDVDTLFGHLYQLSTFICQDKLRSLVVLGSAGSGKSFTIDQAIKDTGLIKGKDYVKLSGKATAMEIYKTLFMYRNGGMILFDDLDTMWKDKEAANFLKAALDTSPIREITALSARNINVSKMSDEDKDILFAQIDKQIAGEDQDEPEEDDEEEGTKKKPKVGEKLRYPSMFEFTGRVIFISNLRKDELDPAILSRSAKIDMTLTAEEVLVRMRSILPTLGGTDVSIEIKSQLIEQLMKLHHNGEIDQVTMREFGKALAIVRSGAPNWAELVRYS